MYLFKKGELAGLQVEPWSQLSLQPIINSGNSGLKKMMKKYF